MECNTRGHHFAFLVENAEAAYQKVQELGLPVVSPPLEFEKTGSRYRGSSESYGRDVTSFQVRPAVGSAAKEANAALYAPGATMPVDDRDLGALDRAIELAAGARAKGNHPFGSLLVDPDGGVLLEAENTVVTTGVPLVPSG